MRMKILTEYIIQPIAYYYWLIRWHLLYRHKITITWPNLERWVDLGTGNSMLTDDLNLQIKSTLNKYEITDWQVHVEHAGVLTRTFTLGFKCPAYVTLLQLVNIEKNI